MFAALPMYDRPENAADHDRLWALIRDALRARAIMAPDGLDRAVDYMAGWARPDLVLGQICNLPYRALYRGRVTEIGAADYGLDGCPPGYYRSHFVVRRDESGTRPQDFAGRRIAFNDAMSHSGWGSAFAYAQSHGFHWGAGLRTGAHIESLRAVARGAADIAAIDAHTFEILESRVPEIRTLKVVGHTAASPGMTFITRGAGNAADYRAAIASAIAALPADSAQRLGLRGIVALAESAYDLPLPEAPESVSN